MNEEKPTVLEQIDAGLATFIDIEKTPLPKGLEERFGQMSVESLLEIDDLGLRLDTAVKVQRGFIWIMIKRKTAHGDFKKFVHDQGRKYQEIWNCMCYARAYQRSPDVGKFFTKRMVPHLLQLSSDKVASIEEAIIGLPAEQAKKVTRDFIEAEYTKIQEEKQRNLPRKEPKGPLPPIPSKLLQLATRASSYLLQIAYHDIPQADYPHLEQLRHELHRAWDRAWYNIEDPKHETVPIWDRGNSDDVSGTFSDEEIEKLREELGLGPAEGEDLEN